MEFILELICEIIFEGSVELSTHKKVPMPIRIIAFVLVFGLMALIAGIVTMVGFDYLAENNIGGAIFFFVISVLLVMAFIWGLIRTHKENSRNDEEINICEAKPSNKGHIIIACIISIAIVLIGAYILYTYELF